MDLQFALTVVDYAGEDVDVTAGWEPKLCGAEVGGVVAALGDGRHNELAAEAELVGHIVGRVLFGVIPIHWLHEWLVIRS